MSDLQADVPADASSTPRYREIHDALRERIISGSWPPGYKLPSEPELAKKFDCARMTVSKALAALASLGLITRRRRAGTVVNSPRPQESILEIHDIESEIIAAGHAYRYECLHREMRRASTADAAALSVSRGTPVLVLVGLHRADGRPHALEERLINLAAVPDARREKFSSISPGRWLLAQVPWTEAEHQISALNPDRTAAQRLGIRQNEACLCIERTTWLDTQHITYARILYPADQHRLIARFQYDSVRRSA
jgi:GntR family transcriptional regulator, histidine utilization repressor